jgi:hypothetical protein
MCSAAVAQMTYQAVAGTKLEKLLVPRKSSVVVGTGRRDEIVTQGLERNDVLHPHVDALLRGQVGLAGLVRPRERVRTGDKGNAETRTRSYQEQCWHSLRPPMSGNR